jgi:peptidoglycan-N-acetylglucosamine deacetylase
MLPTVALTFDDGPSAWTVTLLDVLAEHDAHATFFVLGCNIDGREDTLRRMTAAGHELAVHGWSHKRVEDMTEGALLAQLEMTSLKIEKVASVVPRWWRPPWGRAAPAAAEVAARVNLAWCGVTLDGFDVSRGEDAIVHSVISGLTPGAVVGLHDGIAANGQQQITDRLGTVRAVARILEQCRSVTVSELLG